MSAAGKGETKNPKASKTIKYRDCMYVWNAREGGFLHDPQMPPGIRIVPFPDDGSRQGYKFSDGACWLITHRWKKNRIQQKLLIDVADLVGFAKLTLDEVHQAFLQIEEYAEIDFDTTGYRDSKRFRSATKTQS